MMNNEEVRLMTMQERKEYEANVLEVEKNNLDLIAISS